MGEDLNKYFEEGKNPSVRRNRFDSISEEKVCLILNRILNDYDLDKFMKIRLTPQQALDNYVKVNNEEFKWYYENKHRWMKFDFIFENVYENQGKMNYVPVAVVEFDGPHHNNIEQKKLDAYKDGIAVNIGAGMVRIEYDKLEKLNEKELREQYEIEIIKEIIKGYFTKSINNRKEQKLITEDNMHKFQYVVEKYEQALKKSSNKKYYYSKMLSLLYYQKEQGYISPN